MDKQIKCIRKNIDIKLLERCSNLVDENSETILEKSTIFALLGNEVRLKIMYLFLNEKNLCVCDLSDILGMKQSPISQHLRKLKDGGLLASRRDGMTIFYFVPLNKLVQIQKIIEG